MFHHVRSITALLGISLASTSISSTAVLAQELSVEIPVVGGGQNTDLSRERAAAPNELPKASGFEELTAPVKPVLPYVEDSETVTLPPPAKLVEPTPEAPKAKAVVKPKAVTKPKAVVKPQLAVPLPRVKPKVAAKPKVAIKPKAATKPKAVAEPKAVTEPKTAALPKVTVKPKAAVKPRLAIPLPRTAPKSIVKTPVIAKTPVPTKTVVTEPFPSEDIPFVGVEAAPKIEQPKVTLDPVEAQPTQPVGVQPADLFKIPPVATEETELGEPTELVKFKTGPIVQLPEVTSGPIAPVSSLGKQDQAVPQKAKAGKADRIDRN